MHRGSLWTARVPSMRHRQTYAEAVGIVLRARGLARVTSVTCDPYRSRDIYGIFFALFANWSLLRQACLSRRRRPCELAFGRSPCIGGNFLRPAPLARPCFRRRAAIARIAHPLDRRTLEHPPVQPQWIGKRPRSELQKALLLLRRRAHSCALLSHIS